MFYSSFDSFYNSFYFFPPIFLEFICPFKSTSLCDRFSAIDSNSAFRSITVLFLINPADQDLCIAELSLQRNCQCPNDSGAIFCTLTYMCLYSIIKFTKIEPKEPQKNTVLKKAIRYTSVDSYLIDNENFMFKRRFRYRLVPFNSIYCILIS